MLPGLAAALAAAVAFGVAAILQAQGVRRLPPADGFDPRLVVHLLRDGAIVAALALNLSGFLLHLVALRSLPLFLAQAGIAGSLVVTALLAVRLFSDRLALRDWAAVAAVCAGLGLLAAAAGPPGSTGQGSDVAAGLAVAVVLVAVGGLAARKWRGPHGAALLGLLAGLGFAVLSIAARLLPELAPAALARSPATYVMLASGAVAFLLYSLALRRGEVTTATAPMIVTQTTAPAVVGVLLLGDAVRPGGAAGVALGFLLAAGGAVVLARFEGARR
ncbi:MAG: hypothetical protein M3P96_10485 [Actinomycetota bacterium]|nr:hypothetical protein [Actinomycetota bacterium]